MKRILSVIACFIALIFMSFAITKDEPTYKNLKVLPKNTNKKQMDSIMHHFAVSLGVRCNYCHQYNAEQKAMDFASDAIDKKATARQMMKMMHKLNKKYFNVSDVKSLTAKLEVNCYSCHNGKAHPATQLPPPAPRPQADSSRRAQSDTARRS